MTQAQMPNISPDVAIATLAGEMRTGFATLQGNLETLTQEVRGYSQAHTATEKRIEEVEKSHGHLADRVLVLENRSYVTAKQLWIGFASFVAVTTAILTFLAEAGVFRA